MGSMQLQLPDRDFDGYIFDCDGTLVDTMPLHYEAWNYGIQAAGAEWNFPADLFYSWAGRPIDAVVGSLNERFGWDLDPETVTFHKERFFHARSPHRLNARITDQMATAQMIRIVSSLMAQNDNQ